MEKYAIFLDFDGTLSFDNKISEENCKAMQKVQDLGHYGSDDGPFHILSGDAVYIAQVLNIHHILIRGLGILRDQSGAKQDPTVLNAADDDMGIPDIHCQYHEKTPLFSVYHIFV